jgi:phosphomannomutase
MAGIYKAYDIRGIYGRDLTDETAERIGRAYATMTGARTVVVGRDVRPHSERLFAALARGLTTQGADVLDLGVCSTPMCYFANGSLGVDGGVMITASHNPAEWNGFKLCRAAAVPISRETGIAEIERLVAAGAFAPPAARPGRVTARDILPAYTDHVARFHRASRRLRLAADMANGCGIWEARPLAALTEMTALHDQPDGTFPNHEANPLDPATLADLQTLVRGGGFDFGAAFDGDADRVGFVDEEGGIVPMDFVTALIARDILAGGRRGVILFDLRSSRVVPETIREAGGTPLMCRVGHAYIKQQMREHDALFAGELSGHYYFRDNFNAESAAMAAVSLANIVDRSGRPLSALVAPLRKYARSGEINIRVKGDARAVLERVKARYADGDPVELDGVSIGYPDWWCNVRVSNTEPLVRLNLEAVSREVMETRRDELLALIGG